MKHTHTLTMTATTTAAALPEAYKYPKSRILLEIVPTDGTVYVGNAENQLMPVEKNGHYYYPVEQSQDCFIKTTSDSVNIIAYVFE